jgi:excisionase family DNA binding protein
VDILQPVKARLQVAAKSRGLSRAALYKLIKDRRLVAFKVGRATLVNLADLDALIEEQQVSEFPNAAEMSRRRREGAARKKAAARQRSPTLLGA